MVHQLNLVLEEQEPSRLKMAVYRDALRARQAGKDIAEFLGVPLLDQAPSAVEGAEPGLGGVDGRQAERSAAADRGRDSGYPKLGGSARGPGGC